MGEELTAKEILETIGEICKVNKCCDGCPFDEIRRSEATCHQAIAKNAKEVIEICKKWKAYHKPIETEWRYICRVIEDTGNRKVCVYEEDITEREEELPFEGGESEAEKILKEYCKNHKGKFFATIEHVCRVKGD